MFGKFSISVIVKVCLKADAPFNDAQRMSRIGSEHVRT